MGFGISGYGYPIPNSTKGMAHRKQPAGHSWWIENKGSGEKYSSPHLLGRLPERSKGKFYFGVCCSKPGWRSTVLHTVQAALAWEEIILFFLAIYFAGKNSDKKKLTTRQLVFCAVAIALAFITSYLKIFKLPWGGSVTLCSMLFIVLIANWYGVGTGIMAGFAYGILQFIQEPYILSFFQPDASTGSWHWGPRHAYA